MKKILALLLAVMLLISILAACDFFQGSTDSTGIAADTYTYNSYASSLGTNWNPHTWETDADCTVIRYIEAPLVDITVQDSTTGEYQWIFVAASDIQDVTAEHQDDLTKYRVHLPSGVAASEVTEGYVYEIRLRPEMAWQDGTKINADTYIYSMQQLLDPTMRNRRASIYCSGQGAVAGGSAYFNSGAPIYDNVISSSADDPAQNVDPTAVELYINLDSEDMNIAGYSFTFMLDHFVDDELYKTLKAEADKYGYIRVTEENTADIVTIMDQYLAALDASIYLDEAKTEVDMATFYLFCFYSTGTFRETVSYDSTVGLYKVDDYTIRYVCGSACDYYSFLNFCTTNWIVHEELYESCKAYSDDGTFQSTSYGTSLDTTLSCGPYKITALEGDKMVLQQNEQYWEYTTDGKGNLSSETFFQVDGATQPQYLTQKIVIQVMDDTAAKLAFLAGELDYWAPSAEDAVSYSTSGQLYRAEETYLQRLFFHTDLDTLKELDATGNNRNSVVLSTDTFRKAMSLAIDRGDFVTATPGFTPAYTMLNSLYFYDVSGDPASIYRNSGEAMQAVCNIYGVTYGEGTPYATLEEAYRSIDGYDQNEAKALFAQACEELVAAGLYAEGEPIRIHVAWMASTHDDASRRQVALLNQHLNAALEGTGFGTIQLIGVDNLSDRYTDVINGTYAMGFGAWGGPAIYPFRYFQVYCDPNQYSIHESGCWDPSTEMLTLAVGGEKVTMTWQAWSNSMVDSGIYADASSQVKLQILAGLEENLLETYYMIPLCSTTQVSMLSHKVSGYTENYSVMYGFGGIRLMKYHYTNDQWADFVSKEDGEIYY